MNKYFLIALGVIAISFGGFVLFRDENEIEKNPNQISCTTEAKLCPDGSYVGRSGPKCEFTECPIIKQGSTIKQGTKAKIAEKILSNGVYITPNEVIEDSRCPVDVTCIWAGQVRLNVTLRNALNDMIDELNTTLTLGKSVMFGGKSIELIDVTPVPDTRKTINAKDYIFTFQVK